MRFATEQSYSIIFLMTRLLTCINTQSSDDICGNTNIALTSTYCGDCGSNLKDPSIGIPPRSALIPGSIAGNYKVDRILGAGGMGIVYQANRDVALKESLGITGEALPIQTLVGLDHVGLPRFYEQFQTSDPTSIFTYLAMERIIGPSVGKLISQAPKGMQVRDVVNLVRELAEPLHYLHRQSYPILHRDIKPDNILIDQRSGQVKLVDLGIAKQGWSRTGTISQAVSLPYSPLEQYSGIRTSPATDIYSLGATMHHMLTGQEPVPAVNRAAGFDIEDLTTSTWRNIPAEVASTVMRSLTLDQKGRFQSVRDFLHSLGGIMHKSAVVPKQMPQVQQPATGLTIPSPVSTPALLQFHKTMLLLAASDASNLPIFRQLKTRLEAERIGVDHIDETEQMYLSQVEARVKSVTKVGLVHSHQLYTITLLTDIAEDARASSKLLPISFGLVENKDMPAWLSSLMYLNLSNPKDFDIQFSRLLKVLG